MARRLSLLCALGLLLAVSFLLWAEVGLTARRLRAREQARELVAEALAGSHRPEEQAALYRQARTADPTWDASPCQRGSKLERQGHWSAAAESFRACVELDPRQAWSRFAWAQSLLRSKGSEVYREVRGGLLRFLETAPEEPASRLDQKGRQEVQKLAADLEDLLAGDNPHDQPERYTAEDILQILLRPRARGSSRYDGPRVPLRLGFRPGDATLGTKAEEQLREVALALRDGSLAGAELQIEGHTDSVEGGSHAGRQALSRQRAAAAREFLVQRCGIRSHSLKIAGSAEDYPFKPNGTDAGRAANRRVELVNLRERELVRGDVRDRPLL